MTTDRPPLAARALVGVALAYVALQLIVANRYGFHRDELYFLEAGRHLALGYVDQPPLVPLLARLQSALLGSSPAALRVNPAMVGATTAVLAGALAREFGGGRWAQGWAAAAIAGAGMVLSLGHLLATATFDFAFWLALLLVVTRMLRTGDARLWVTYGGLAGIALWNKHLPVLLSVALLLGLVADRRWELLRPRWLLSGGALAALLIAPHLLWQATNEWPQVQTAGALSDRLGTENRITLLPLQLLLLGPLVVPLAVTGIRWVLRDGRRFRPLLWAYIAGLAITFASGGRPYYPLPLAAVLVVMGVVAAGERSASGAAASERSASGAAASERSASGAAAGGDATGRTPRWVLAVIAANLVVGVPLSLPVLPIDTLAETPIGEINDTLVEQIGWRALAEQVAAVVEDLPVEERGRAVLLTGSYGEAGALDRYGPALGLPAVYSGHNGYWGWRQPTDDDATVVAVRLSTDFLTQHFGSCAPAGTVDNGRGIDNEAQGAPITVCRGLRGTWADRWPDFRHLS